MGLPWEVTTNGPGSCTIAFTGDYRRKDFVQTVLVTGDRHWDNVDSDQRLQKKHLDYALEHNIPVIDNGDFFCLMQGKYDPRSSKSKLRPEHQGSKYFDLVHDTAVDFFTPYAPIMASIGYGNHETACIRKHETDILANFIRNMNAQGNGQCHQSGYRGFVNLTFQGEGGKGQKAAVLIHHFHGSGGGAPVTQGTIQGQRQHGMVPDADVVVLSHTHYAWIMPRGSFRRNKSGRVYHSHQLGISTPTYKDEIGVGDTGWLLEKGSGPKPIGCVWLKIRFRQDRTVPGTSTLEKRPYRHQRVVASAELDI